MNAADHPHLSPAEAAAFGRPAAAGGMSPAARLAASDHAAGCPECRARLRQATGMLAAQPAGVFSELLAEAQRADAAPEPPSFEQLASSAAATHDEAALAATLRVHPFARRELEDLRAFQTRLAAFPEETFSPGGTLPPASIRPAGARHTPWWDRLLPWRSPVGFAFAALLLLLGSAGAWRQFGSQRPAAPRLVDGSVQVNADNTLQTAAELPAALRDAVIEAIRHRAVPGLAGAAVGLTRGGDGNVPAAGPSPAAPRPPAPVSPAGTTLETARPTLRWTAVPGANGYEISVLASATGQETASGPLPSGTTAWTPPAPLPRGQVYRWRVTASAGPGGETLSAAGLFKLIPAVAAQELARAREQAGGSRLILAVAYARAGLADEARRELAALRDAHPDSDLAAELARSAGAADAP